MTRSKKQDPVGGWVWSTVADSQVDAATRAVDLSDKQLRDAPLSQLETLRDMAHNLVLDIDYELRRRAQQG